MTTATTAIATSTCFQVVCRVRPEYVDFVRDFIDHGDWPLLDPHDEGHKAVSDWLQFQREHGHAMIHNDKNNYRGVIFQPEKHDSFMDGCDNSDIFYHNSPPFGVHSPRWGQKCELIIYYRGDDDKDDQGNSKEEEEDKSRIWWEFAGQTLNKNGEIDFFVRRVVAALSDDISLYRTWKNYE
jgi:hypothetical protein